MFKVELASAGKDRSKQDSRKNVFGVVKLAPRLESAFVFPAAVQPRGVVIHGTKKGPPSVSKKL